MNLRNLLLSVAAIAASPLFAETYYVTPEGAGSKDGSSWENAFGVEELIAKAAANENGDVYNFAGGVYKPSDVVSFKAQTGATLNGNTEGERTVFSGDVDGDNIPTDMDLDILIKVQANTTNGISTNLIKINNIDFTCVFTDNTDGNNTNIGALMIDNSGDVQVQGCRFYNNKATGTQGGAPCQINRSTVKFTNCDFYKNTCESRGAAIRLRSGNNGDTPDKNAAKKGFTTFENCVFKENTTNDNLGVIFAATANQVNLINSVVVNNVSNGTEKAATIFLNPKGTFANQLTIINSTIAGNTPSQIGFNGKGANLRMVNSIIVGAEGTNAIDFSADEDFANVMSGGYNYVGPISVGEFWQDTDNHGTDCTYASIFGDNTLNSDNQLVPVKYVAGASGEQVTSATADWGLPTGLSLTTDAAGNTRAAGMTPGANSFTEAQIKDFTTSVITVINDAENTPHLVKVANSVYTVEGTTEGITVYTVNGATVAATSSNTVDLSSFANGLYILKSGNAIFKIMK